MDWKPQWKGICSSLCPRPECITVQTASLACWNISERKLPTRSNIYNFSSKILHFCPDFLWIREGVSELLCNASQKELIFGRSARIEMFQHLKWQRELDGKERIFRKRLWPWINVTIPVTPLDFLLYIHTYIFIYTHNIHTIWSQWILIVLC